MQEENNVGGGVALRGQAEPENKPENINSVILRANRLLLFIRRVESRGVDRTRASD